MTLIRAARGVSLQVSLKSAANPRLLLKTSFKHSVNTYWITSKEDPDSLWLEELPPSSVEVEKFKMRVHDGCDVKSFFTFADCFEHFLTQFEAKVCGLASGTSHTRLSPAAASHTQRARFGQPRSDRSVGAPTGQPRACATKERAYKRAVRAAEKSDHPP